VKVARQFIAWDQAQGEIRPGGHGMIRSVRFAIDAPMFANSSAVVLREIFPVSPDSVVPIRLGNPRVQGHVVLDAT
jgi:hypothetical protein